MGFIDEHTGWAGGWGDAEFERLSSSATIDGGVTWHDANEIGKAINRFRFFGNLVTVGYASGQTVYKYERTAAAGVARFPLRAQRETPLEIQRTHRAEGVYLPLGQVNLGTTVLVTIYSRFGDEVTAFETQAEESSAGAVLFWNLRDAAGQLVPAGHYIVRFTRGTEVFSSLLHLKQAGVPESGTKN